MGWQVDTAHTQVSFAVRHLGISLIRGRMKLAESQLVLDEAQPERSSLTARMDVSSLDTGEPGRDGHLKTGDFLNVETYPYISFVSRQVKRPAEGKVEVAGDLTIRDITRPLTLSGDYSGPQLDPLSGKRKVGFSLSGQLNKTDYGIQWNVPMEGGFMLADRLTLTIDAQAIET